MIKNLYDWFIDNISLLETVLSIIVSFGTICGVVYAFLKRRVKKKSQTYEIESSVNSSPDLLFKALMEQSYEILKDYREAFRSANQDEIHASTAKLDSVMREVYAFSERYSVSEKKLSVAATNVVNLYNSYVESFRKFISYDDLNSPIAQDCAKTAEQKYKTLQNNIISLL